MKTLNYASYGKEQLKKAFSTSLTEGLTTSQVTAYQKKYGRNSIEEHETPWWSLLIRQYNTPFAYLLLSAAGISFFLHDLVNALTISGIVFLNGLLSFYQEYKAEQALKLIQEHLIMKATVIRDGKTVVVDNKELVPGDIVILQTGDYVPADIVLFEGSLQVNESILTGESMPSKKNGIPQDPAPQDVYQALNTCFLATIVVGGNARGVVVAIGSKTMLGEISHLTIKTVQYSGFQERTTRLSKFILSVVVITIICIVTFHLLAKGSKTDIVQLLLFAMALTLGLTPEALPTVITFALSRGALQLVKHNVVVKRLSAIEDLGAITVLCTDKTGTLTENNLSVNAVYEVKQGTVLPFMLLASKKEGSLDPFDNALLKAASADLHNESRQYSLIKEIPFNPDLRRNSMLISKNDESMLVTRGAFESIEKLSLPFENRDQINQWIVHQAEQGNRVLAVAYKKSPPTDALDEEKDFTFVGLTAFYDPIKSTTHDALTKASELGITIKMVTGDSKEVASAVARQIGLEDTIITGPEFRDLSPEEKRKAVHTYTLFARIIPQQKFEIVNLLKKGNVVGFIGDGINDAPALKAAHVGLVVEGASNVAKDAAEIVLLNPSLAVIIRGIEIGRNIFSNTMKYILAVTASTFGNCISLALASVWLDFLPLLPMQILLVNLLSDMPMIAIAADSVDQDKIKKPQNYDLRSLAFSAGVLALTSSFFDFVTFSFFYRQGPEVLRTNWFIESILTELVLIYSVRTAGVFYKAQRPSWILLSISTLAALTAITIPSTRWGKTLFKFVKPEWHSLGIIAVIVVCYFIASEIVKLLFYKVQEVLMKKRIPNP
ncbi:cation-transporting P-type ATPase [Candidatus Dependentiae bacterium]|nr:cation-transporting P-type ATPase [Candidatus Dependentiae bacterium]